ncbi:MAG: YbaB/EbfC family nucleoid-associated protein [Bacilli bacterium]|nr:YbaB/EbfC family nucleoid-associated protein [Bacilli bacterium]
MNQALIRKVQQMQKEMEQTQREIENTVFHGSIAGVVKVEVMGNRELVTVNIDPHFEISDEDDREVLNDAIVASCNQAYEEIDKVTEEKMGKYQALLGGMGGMF